ncbi:hypothetical protein DT73_16990 [Mangrovibacter sp. MFB070]|nr:hypothetical protein DT73_16990 [Mangrovibacter sp. MFB070]
MSAQNERMSPNKKQENQFIDFRLLTKKKEKPRFFLLFHQSEALPCGSAFLFLFGSQKLPEQAEPANNPSC